MDSALFFSWNDIKKTGTFENDVMVETAVFQLLMKVPSRREKEKIFDSSIPYSSIPAWTM